MIKTEELFNSQDEIRLCKMESKGDKRHYFIKNYTTGEILKMIGETKFNELKDNYLWEGKDVKDEERGWINSWVMKESKLQAKRKQEIEELLNTAYEIRLCKVAYDDSYYIKNYTTGQKLEVITAAEFNYLQTSNLWRYKGVENDIEGFKESWVLMKNNNLNK